MSPLQVSPLRRRGILQLVYYLSGTVTEESYPGSPISFDLQMIA